MNKNSSDNEDLNGRKGSHDFADQAGAQLTKIKKAGMNVGGEIESYVKKQPLAALGIAVGAGFVLGSVFGSKLGRIALATAVGYAAQELVAGALGEGGVRKLLVDEVSKLAKGSSTAS